MFESDSIILRPHQVGICLHFGAYGSSFSALHQVKHFFGWKIKIQVAFSYHHHYLGQFQPMVLFRDTPKVKHEGQSKWLATTEMVVSTHGFQPMGPCFRLIPGAYGME